MRVLGIVAAVAFCIYLFVETPENKYTEPFDVKVRAAMIAPALAGALWHLLVFVAAPDLGSGGGRPARWLLATTLTATAALVFVAYNFLEPRVGVVRAVVCYDLADGQQRWSRAVFEAPPERKYDVNSYATPTPCADGARVLAYFGLGWACLDYDGNVLWKGDDPTYTQNTRYGAAASPVRYKDSFLVLQESEEKRRPSFLMALDAESGDVLWRTEPQDAHDSYSTPVLVPRGDGFELIGATFDLLMSYDPDNGQRLWAMPFHVRQMVPSVTYAGDDLLLVAGGSHLKFSTTGLRLAGIGTETKPEIVWQTRRAVPGIASPVLVDGHFYTVNDSGILMCFDPASGNVHFKKRLEAKVWASLVAGDSKVYMVGEEGKVRVLKAGPAFELLAEADLGEACFATPAIGEGAVVVRTREQLYCFRRQ